MVVENMLARTLSLAEEKEKLDAACKRLLANKVILAWIMKHSMDEYRSFRIDDIAEKYIEGTPQVATAPVHRDEGKGELIEGMGTEDASLSEGTVTYDVRFRAVHPVSNEMVRMIINVEGQNDFYPGYPLVKRGIYYGSRMISSQYGTVFTDAEYGKIQKVCSVWVCMNPPKYRQNTINQYQINEKHMVGAVAECKEHYDLMTVIMICLGEPDSASTELLKLLDVLFSETHSAEEKKQILVSEFDIKMTKTLEGEVEQVCDYSNGIWDKGHAQGRVLGREEGREEEREKMLRLIDLMVENGEADRIPGLSKSPEFLDEMLVKYQLA